MTPPPRPLRPLGDIARIVGGSTPSRDVPAYWGGSIPWVTPTDLAPWNAGVRSLTDTSEKITDAGLSACSTQLLPVNSVLFSSRATIGKVGVAGVPVATNQGFASFVPGPDINPWYLAFALHYFAPKIEALAGSTTFKEVTKTSLKGFRLPVPSLDEQLRALARLRAAQDLKDHAGQAQVASKMVLAAVVRDFLESCKPIDLVRLGDLVTLVSGATPSKREERFWNGGVPWVSPKDMKVERISASADTVAAAAVEETNLRLLEPGSVLIVVRGMILAHTVPVAVPLVPVTINQDMKALVPVDPRVTATYLHACLVAMQPQLLDRVTTAGHGTKKLDTAALLALELPVLAPGDHDRMVGLVDQWLLTKGRLHEQQRGADQAYDAVLEEEFGR
jgi:type I restriction enzyme S subunit